MVENNAFMSIGVVERDTGIGRDTLRDLGTPLRLSGAHA